MPGRNTTQQVAGRPVFRALMERLIDYAGLFPPAGLPMERACALYRGYRRTRDAWMLGRFICPVGRLAEWRGQLDEAESGIELSLLGPLTGDAAGLVSRMKEHVVGARRALAGLESRVEVASWELRLPDLGEDNASVICERLTEVIDLLPGHVDGYVEIQPNADPVLLGRLCDTLTSLNRMRSGDAGFKLRCGGLVPDAFPSIEELARVLVACADRALPLKLTAGLHHPLPGLRDGLPMHGFLNVVLAAAACRSYQLRERDVYGLLREQGGAAFRLSADWIEWRELRIAAKELRETRDGFLRSFGSCSFDEPREDLVTLGWHRMEEARKDSH